jgi:hypothetical protein
MKTLATEIPTTDTLMSDANSYGKELADESLSYLAGELMNHRDSIDPAALIHIIREISSCCESVEVKKIAAELFSFIHISQHLNDSPLDISLLREEEELLSDLLVLCPGERKYMKQLAECLIGIGEGLYTSGSVSEGLKYFEKALQRVNMLEDRIGHREFLQMRIRLYRRIIEIYSLVAGTGTKSLPLDCFPLNPLQEKINVLYANYYQDLAKMSYEL